MKGFQPSKPQKFYIPLSHGWDQVIYIYLQIHNKRVDNICFAIIRKFILKALRSGSNLQHSH